MPIALERAPIVIGERVEGMLSTHGHTKVPVSQFTELVDLGASVVELPYRQVSAAESRMAEQVVNLLPNGVTLQFGIGGVPDVVLRGKTLGERAEAMIQISHPKFRDELRQVSRLTG